MRNKLTDTEFEFGCMWLACMLVLIAGGAVISLVLVLLIVARACWNAC
jgi:hypothetical protein